MNASERIEAASSFLLQSPPGEINDVLNDVRNIISDDDSLHAGVLPALKEYNLTQFMTADVPNAEHQSIVSDAARLDPTEEAQERFVDPRSKMTFLFDHLTLEASDPQPFEPDSEAESFRAALEKSTLTYLHAHFHDGVASIFSAQGSTKNFVIQVVANKYNPANYWSGRWRSEYRVDMNESTLRGKILVNVHYYEQGNVQLSTTHDVSLSLPAAVTSAAAPAAASKILALIEDEEGRYQISLNDTYQEMGEKTFKSLRRALPLTRQKIDWDRVTGYKLGAELSSSKNMFGNS
ncbi:F-actin-capping protein subunit alpha [Mycena indigotica]|uniref:F-actin-capping protein subunit alpha n=1 Tax=Mycena indigotica TaxID=2126181 RepID=A0A8H6T494_9AGAR|nr:F-actin-capping protein subunit alpha [Mycena indigotica]KAF7309642.1 F-actin-capping protein subunit alpha [Mycena indigotica]